MVAVVRREWKLLHRLRRRIGRWLDLTVPQMSRNERISCPDRAGVVAASEGELMRHATAGASTQRRMNGIATGQAPGFSTAHSEPATTATTTPQRRSL